MSELGFWDWALLWLLAVLAWCLLLGAVRSLGKAWRNER